MADEDDVGDLTRATPACKSALWIVLLLNLGYGVFQTVGGFIADSQSLKADALDFLGDGTITLIGVLAISWSAIWRARAALLQGIFLAAMGALVLAATVYRVFFLQLPEAELMGGFGVGALIVNVVCAVILLKHRTGDANVQAVWLFSRNDAVGDMAVIIAALLVWLTATPWPDLIIAAAIAGLFLKSAWTIVKSARQELSEAAENVN